MPRSPRQTRHPLMISYWNGKPIEAMIEDGNLLAQLETFPSFRCRTQTVERRSSVED